MTAPVGAEIERKGAGRRATDHSIEDCPQNPTLDRINRTLDRLETHSERTAEALEKIAEQGAMVINHEKRLDKHDQDLREAFKALRDHAQTNSENFSSLSARVQRIEIVHAEEDGEERVVQSRRKFWDEAKLKLIQPVLLGVFFLLWVADKMNLFQRLADLIKEFKG